MNYETFSELIIERCKAVDNSRNPKPEFTALIEEVGEVARELQDKGEWSEDEMIDVGVALFRLARCHIKVKVVGPLEIQLIKKEIMSIINRMSNSNDFNLSIRHMQFILSVYDSESDLRYLLTALEICLMDKNLSALDKMISHLFLRQGLET